MCDSLQVPRARDVDGHTFNQILHIYWAPSTFTPIEQPDQHSPLENDHFIEVQHFVAVMIKVLNDRDWYNHWHDMPIQAFLDLSSFVNEHRNIFRIAKTLNQLKKNIKLENYHSNLDIQGYLGFKVLDGEGRTITVRESVEDLLRAMVTRGIGDLTGRFRLTRAVGREIMCILQWQGNWPCLPPSAGNISLFIDNAEYAWDEAPGAIIVRKEKIVINKGRLRVKLMVRNCGDRPIQIGSHFHFIETNSALHFDRGRAYGMRLDILSGTTICFEPGDSKVVNLCAIAGAKIISGGNSLASGVVDLCRREAIVESLVAKGFGHIPEPGAVLAIDTEISRHVYVSMYGPTVGDRVRLGHTELWIEVERDETVYGEELTFGRGKSSRSGMGQATNRPSSETLDLVITNALIIDWSGIYKTDIGVKDGVIAGIGKAGNPDIMPSVHASLVTGSSTEVIAAEGLIVTAGAIDAHVRFMSPQEVQEALASGTTTIVGGGTGPSTRTNGTTDIPNPFYMRHMLAATDGVPMNFAFTGKGNDMGPNALEDVVKAGAAGLKLHEDWGSTPAAITDCLDVGDKYDVQVNIHTDTLNESGFIETTIAAFGGRTIHVYHTEGIGGGHTPDNIVVCGQKNIIPSSNNPIFPSITSDERENLASAESYMRAEAVAAEDVLHDTGAISMISSSLQRAGGFVGRMWSTANQMRKIRGPLRDLGDCEGKDNARVKRYIAKYTMNPAIVHGLSHTVGHVAVGTLADLVFWSPKNFGMHPHMVMKSGIIVSSQMGNSNVSIPAISPFHSQPMWGSNAASAALNSVSFVSQASITSGIVASYGLSKHCEPVKMCRNLTKKDMKWNNATPKMMVDPESYNVYADGTLMGRPRGR